MPTAVAATESILPPLAMTRRQARRERVHRPTADLATAILLPMMTLPTAIRHHPRSLNLVLNQSTPPPPPQSAEYDMIKGTDILTQIVAVK